MTLAICVLSGGIDSTVLLYHLLDAGHHAKAISFDYGQRHNKELQFAARTCLKLNVEHEVVDISSIGRLLTGSALTDDRVAIPTGDYREETMKLTVVPNRNMIFLAIAGGYAVAQEADILAIAVHAGDHALYPDCRPDFIKHLEEALRSGNYHQLAIDAPFLHNTKAEIVRSGRRLGVDFDNDTWSCYAGGEQPCGVCATCVEREEALGT